jgi:hypothetical protein
LEGGREGGKKAGREGEREMERERERERDRERVLQTSTEGFFHILCLVTISTCRRNYLRPEKEQSERKGEDCWSGEHVITS